MKPVAISAAVSLAALLAGTCLMGAFGHEPPAMLLAWEMAFFTALGLAAGFLWRLPRLPWWATSRPVAGAVLITLGVGAVYVPSQFIVSSLLLGAGARLLWLALSETPGTGTALARTVHTPSADLAAAERPAGNVACTAASASAVPGRRA